MTDIEVVKDKFGKVLDYCNIFYPPGSELLRRTCLGALKRF